MTATATFEEQTNQQVSAGVPVERAGEVTEHRPSRRERRKVAKAARAVERYRQATADAQTVDQFKAPARPARTPTDRFTLVVSLVSHALLAGVVVAAAAASWHNLIGFAQDTLDLEGAWRYVAPLSLDAAAMACAAIALRAIIDGESAAMARFLTLGLMSASCAANAYHSHATNQPLPAAFYFGGMSILAVVLFDVVLKQIRLRALRKAGRARKPRPSFGIDRWLVSPLETRGAWVTAVRENIDNPDAAVTRYREVKATKRAAKAVKAEADEPALVDEPVDEQDQADEQPSEQRPPRMVVELVNMQVQDQIRAAFRHNGSYHVGNALKFLATEHSIEVDRSYAYDVRRKLDAKLREIWAERDDLDVDGALDELAKAGEPTDRKFTRDLARKVAGEQANTNTEDDGEQAGRQLSVVAGGEA